MMRINTSTKVWLFLILCSTTALLLGYYFGGRIGLAIAFWLTFAFHILVFFFGRARILQLVKARPLAGRDPWGAIEMSNQLANKVGLTPPNIYIFDSPTATAFSIGGFRAGTLCVSQGLLNKLSPTELRAVIAHEICHLNTANGFGFLLALTLVFAQVGLAGLLDKPWPKQAFFRRALSPLIWLTMRTIVSEKVYLDNDRSAATLISSPQVLAETLWKLSEQNSNQPLKLPPYFHHFFIVNPQSDKKLPWLLAQPRVEKRIERLVGYFPI